MIKRKCTKITARIRAFSVKLKVTQVMLSPLLWCPKLIIVFTRAATESYLLPAPIIHLPQTRIILLCVAMLPKVNVKYTALL